MRNDLSLTLRIAMTSQDTSKPKMCGKSVAIMKICELLRKLQSLLDFAKQIQRSQNPGGTGINRGLTGVIMFKINA